MITLEIHKKSTNRITCNKNTYKCSHVYDKLVATGEGLNISEFIGK